MQPGNVCPFHHVAVGEAVCTVTAAVGPVPMTVGVGGGGLTGLSILVTAQVDPDNVIAEFDETNNSFSQTFQT